MSYSGFRRWRNLFVKPPGPRTLQTLVYRWLPFDCIGLIRSGVVIRMGPPSANSTEFGGRHGFGISPLVSAARSHSTSYSLGHSTAMVPVLLRSAGGSPRLVGLLAHRKELFYAVRLRRLPEF